MKFRNINSFYLRLLEIGIVAIIYYGVGNDGYNKQKAEVFSTEFALKMVNSWAYEYAAHAKAKKLAEKKKKKKKSVKKKKK